MDENRESTEFPTEPESRDERAGVRWGLVATLLLIVAIIVLAAQNTEPVTVRLLAWQMETPLTVVVLTAAVVAVLADELLGMVWRLRRRRKRRREQELEQPRGYD